MHSAEPKGSDWKIRQRHVVSHFPSLFIPSSRTQMADNGIYYVAYNGISDSSPYLFVYSPCYRLGGDSQLSCPLEVILHFS